MHIVVRVLMAFALTLVICFSLGDTWLDSFWPAFFCAFSIAILYDMPAYLWNKVRDKIHARKD